MLDVVAIGSIIKDVLFRVLPDTEAEKAIEKLEIDTEYQLLLKQLEVNKVEAANPSIFVSGWRPFVGWVCAVSFAYHFVVAPIIAIFGIPLPHFDVTSLLTVLSGLLGLSGIRTYEKTKGVARR